MTFIQRRIRGRKTMSEDSGTITEVTNLEQLLTTLRDAVGALGSQADQIGQMRGMFGDEDGTIQDAVDAGEDAEAGLELAISYVESLIAARNFDEETARAAEQGEADHIAERTAEAAGLKAPFPTVLGLLAMRDDVVAAIDDATSSIDGDDGTTDVEIPFDLSNAEALVVLLEGAARSVATPIEIAVHIDGGAVQGVTRTAEETRPASVYVHDHDTEGHTDSDGELAEIRFDNANDEHDLDECVLAVHTGGKWETAPTDGPYWTTLRAEADRLELRS